MLKKYLSIVIAAFLSLQSLPAFAEHWERDHDGRDRHWRFDNRRLPHGFVALALRGRTYFYNDGLFYTYTPSGYVFIDPPIGAIVPALPPGYTTVVIRQKPYFYYQNIYYEAAPAGYVVSVPPEAPLVSQAPVSTPPRPGQASPPPGNISSYDIYIPNDNGSYTLVTLKKAEKGGFVGPQGEFYPEHPTVEQLKTLYGISKK